MIRVVFWDIDGTLLTTARAGVFALEDAAREVLDVEASFHQLRNVGTDGLGGGGTRNPNGGQGADPRKVEAFLRAYERCLPERLHMMRRGAVLPGVSEILNHFEGRDDLLNLLLTGNTPGGARAKLAHYGIARYFRGGAFCVDGAEREEIARRALKVAAE